VFGCLGAHVDVDVGVVESLVLAAGYALEHVDVGVVLPRSLDLGVDQMLLQRATLKREVQLQFVLYQHILAELLTLQPRHTLSIHTVLTLMQT